MRFTDLPLGTVITLGTNPYQAHRYRWTKVTGSLCMKTEGASLVERLSIRDSDPNYYPKSYVHSWLNSVEDGFLSHFAKEEREVMRPFSIRVTAPRGSVRKYGKVSDIEVMSAIPSATEIGAIEPGLCSADQFSYLPSYIRTWTRTPSGKKSFVFRAGNRFVSNESDKYGTIAPLISIQPNANFSQNEMGYFVLGGVSHILDLDSALKDF